jgi:hypothetical protein
MEQLDDARVDLINDRLPAQSPVAKHLKSSTCKRPAHFRPSSSALGGPADTDDRASQPQHLRVGGPLHMAPEAVRISRLAPTASPHRPTAAQLANAAFVRRLHTSRPVPVWPENVAERLTNSSVWPDTLRSKFCDDVEDCLQLLLYSPASADFVNRRRAAMRPVYPTLPFWESRWSAYRQNLSKPVPLGIAAGLSAVLALSQTSENTTAPSLASASERTSEETASRGMLRGAFVATPAMAQTPTTTTTVPPTTTAKPPPTTAKPKPKAPATVPPQTSQCSTSKAAAHACWDGLIGQYNWNTTTAFNIMWCESRGNPNAKNPRSTATGLFQILNGPYDPAANVKLAYEMYSKRGWQPWVCKG